MCEFIEIADDRGIIRANKGNAGGIANEEV